MKTEKEDKIVRKKCRECGGFAEEKIGMDTDGLGYRYWKCTKCGDEILTMDQLHELAEKEKRMLAVKISKWGAAIAIRIPKRIAENYNLVPGKKATIIPEKTGFKVVSRKTK